MQTEVKKRKSSKPCRFAVCNIDCLLHNLHTNRNGYNKILAIFISLAVYLVIILLFGRKLGVSSNYFVIIPLIATSFSFGFAGGLVSGLLSLPLNILMFHILGHPEFSPENKLIATLSGLTVGIVLGYLSDYYCEIEVEVEGRREAEKRLQQSLQEKEILLQEIHHRVKNNLNIVKSLIQLQSSRSDSEEFKEEADKMIRRIYSISRVHEHLHRNDRNVTPVLTEYIPELVDDILKSLDDGSVKIETEMNLPPLEMSIQQATSLGLILNEVLTNMLKHGLSNQDEPWLKITGYRRDGRIVIEMLNNGPAFIPGSEDSGGLGLKLIKALSDQIEAECQWLSGETPGFKLSI